jgi:DNA-binding response OmpR family regulator
MYKILIVDDEDKIRELIKKYIKFENNEAYEASNGMQAVEMCSKNNFDIIIMDAMMPELDGFSAIKKIREHSQTPVIMLSARGEEYDKIHGFELGIDDYVVKPFSPKELMMRIDAVLKRTNSTNKAEPKAEHEIFTATGLKVDFTARLVFIDNNRIELSPREYDLLFYMIRNRNIALSRDKLLTDVWGYDFYGDDRTLDTHIKMLRKSLGKYKHFVVTLRGTGYRFEV